MYWVWGHIPAWRYHLGIDYSSREFGNWEVKPLPIRAGIDGELTFKNTRTKWKEASIIWNGWLCNYLHLEKFEWENRYVTAWEIIGYVWNTWTYTTAPHLHMGVSRTYAWWARVKDGLDLWWVNFENMLTDDALLVRKSSMQKTYKWVRVRLMNRDFKRVIWYYDEKSQEIRLYDRFFTKSIQRQSEILEHEYAHYIYFSVMTQNERDFWVMISEFNLKLVGVINDRAKTNYQENEYINEELGDAMNKQDRIPSEDFAECVEYLFRVKWEFDFKWFLHIKLSLAKAFMNKYT